MNLTSLVAEIRLLGMRSIYYFCSNPSDKWKLLMDAGVDALSLEEGKKDFEKKHYSCFYVHNYVR